MARILIVEDNWANLELARYLLEAGGHAITTATDGAAGIERAVRMPPDLVLCDLQMPVLDGYAVLVALRRNPVTRHVAVVALTAFSMQGDREKILTAGFAGYFSKPIDPDTFVRSIEAFLPPPVRDEAEPDRGLAPGRPDG
jgi:CheY-like chemotaxis protein